MFVVNARGICRIASSDATPQYWTETVGGRHIILTMSCTRRLQTRSDQTIAGSVLKCYSHPSIPKIKPGVNMIPESYVSTNAYLVENVWSRVVTGDMISLRFRSCSLADSTLSQRKRSSSNVSNLTSELSARDRCLHPQIAALRFPRSCHFLSLDREEFEHLLFRRSMLFRSYCRFLLLPDHGVML